jgi:hypothetical protein
MTTPVTMTGEEARDRALGRLDRGRRPLIRLGQRALLAEMLARRVGVPEATADDVRRLVSPPPGIDPRYFGAVTRGLARAGILRAVGVRKSGRREAHARTLTVWRLTSRDAAAQWLLENPGPGGSKNPGGGEGGGANGRAHRRDYRPALEAVNDLFSDVSSNSGE